MSVQELQDGFIQMKTATKGLERILAFLEQTFAAADTDSGGTLDKEEFQTASADLRSNGVRVSKIGKINKISQILGGLVLGCIKTIFCK